MKICMYYVPSEDSFGGSNSFMLTFKQYLIDKGVGVTHDINADYDVLLLNAAHRATGKYLDLNVINNVRKTGYSDWMARAIHIGRKRKRIIVHRVDGMRSDYAGVVGDKLDSIQAACFPMADHTIFQSRYVYEYFLKNGFDIKSYSIVHNGADQNKFNLKKIIPRDISGAIKIIACSWSDNSRKGHEKISLISEIDGVEVDFIGRWCPGIDSRKVNMLGVMKRHELAEVFKSHDAYFAASQNEPCSNTLMEALSCGLPVLYLNSGSHKEIAGEYGIEYEHDDPERSISELKKQYKDLALKTERNNHVFSMKRSGEEYLEIIKKMI